MAKGPYITQDIKELIVRTYLKYPGWRAKEIQKEVSDLSGGYGPGLSAIQKELTRIRANHLELVDNHEDIIWSLHSYYDFEIPPDALPTVLNVWLIARKEDRIAITNREVKWVVRLYKVIKDVRMLKDRAKSLAFSELVGEILHSWSMAHPGRPLNLIEDMTGKRFTEEEAASIRLVKSPDHIEEALQHLEARGLEVRTAHNESLKQGGCQ